MPQPSSRAMIADRNGVSREADHDVSAHVVDPEIQRLGVVEFARRQFDDADTVTSSDLDRRVRRAAVDDEHVELEGAALSVERLEAASDRRTLVERPDDDADR